MSEQFVVKLCSDPNFYSINPVTEGQIRTFDRQQLCEGTEMGVWYIVLCLFLDNSDSPSIVEQ